MSYLAPFTVTDNQVQLTTTLPSPATAANGRLYNAAGAVYVADSATVTSWANGMAFDGTAAMLIYDASLGLPAATVYHSGLPRYNNRLCVDVLNAADHVANGVPFTSSGAVAAGGAAGSFSLSTSFYAPLQTSLVPLTAAGSGVPTFTRATPAYVSDFEGVLRQAVSGEARFSGARRVRNGVGFSEDMLNALWSQYVDASCTLTATANAGANPFGGSNATRIQANVAAAVNGFAIRISPDTPNGSYYACSVYLKSNTGATQTVMLRQGHTGLELAVSVTSSWQRFVLTGQSPGGIVRLDIRAKKGLTSDVVDVLAWGAQVEDVSGASNQAPSEYVSVGVLAAPWHGAGVDGVKYFATTNGNSVAGNVVTEAAGTALPDATLKGYFCEGQRTNLALQSQTFENAAWTKENVTESVNAAIAPDGTTTADKLVTNTVNIVHITYPNGIPSLSIGQGYTYSIYAKSAGYNFINLNGLSTFTKVYFDLATGVVSQTGAGHAAIITAVSNGWYRCSITFTADATNIALLQLGIAPANGVETFPGDGVSGVYIWGAQLEAAPFASSYIPTTTAAATRNNDSLQYPNTGNISDTVGSVYYELTQTNDVMQANGAIVGSNGINRFLIYTIGSIFKHFDGTNNPYLDASYPVILGLNKVAQNWSGVAASGFIRGNKGSTSPALFDGSYEFTDISIGIANSNQLNCPYGNIRNVRIYPAALTDAQLQGITS